MLRGRVRATESGLDPKVGGALASGCNEIDMKYLKRSESLEVDIKDLEHFLLAPDEPNVDIKHIALRARVGRHQNIFRTFARQGGHEIGVASAARWDEHERMLIIHEQKYQELCPDRANERETRIAGHRDGKEEDSAKRSF